MKPKTKKILKWTGIILGSLILLVVGLGIYIYSVMPKPIGSPPKLQAALFARPQQELPMEGKYIYKTATELARMIRYREATSVEIVTEFLANIKNNNYKYNALIWLRENEALQDAKLADEMVARGDTLNKPLLGVPITIKEMYWVKGSPSTFNAKMFGFIAPDDAVVVKHLKDAGAVILGTTNVPFMLSDYQTYGEVYPTANNPYDTTRTPGGSTGGGAAALAAGFTTLELGSDLGGSIRVPASFCGLYSLKPTFGTINITQGTSPDTVTKFTRIAMASGGPLARTAEDLELAWKVLKSTKPDDRFQQPFQWKPKTNKQLDQYKVAWMDEWKHGNKTFKLNAEVKNIIIKLADSLKQNGVQISKTAPDTYGEMKKLFYGSFASMMSEGMPWLLRKFMAMQFKSWDDDKIGYQALKDGFEDNSDQKWQELQKDRERLVTEWEAFFGQYDFLICPVAYGPAIKKCPPGSALPVDNGTMPYFKYTSPAFIINATGHPSITVPMGLNKEGVPIGVQIVSAYYNEDELLHFAKLISKFTPGFMKPSK